MASNIRIAPFIRVIELLLFVALCALAARWVTILFAGAALPVPPSVESPQPPASNLAAEMLKSARLFGSHPPGSLSENVQALGVIAPESGRGAGPGAGSAIISVDGKPPRAYRVGSDVEGRRLVAIRATEIEMEGNGVRQVFRLPPRTYSSASPTEFMTGGNSAAGSQMPLAPNSPSSMPAPAWPPAPPPSTPISNLRPPRGTLPQPAGPGMMPQWQQSQESSGSPAGASQQPAYPATPVYPGARPR